MQARIGVTEGMFVCPEGAATLVAAQALREREWIAPHERVLAINTGAGQKYLDVMVPELPLLPRDGSIKLRSR
jgi:threonine synthase